MTCEPRSRADGDDCDVQRKCSRLLIALALVAGVLIAVAATASVSMPALATVRVEPSPSLSEAATLPIWAKKGIDAQLDRIRYHGQGSIHYAPGALSTCGFFLVVKTGQGTTAIRIPEPSYKEEGWPIRTRWPFSEPQIVTVIELGSGGGQQFVVARNHGAAVISVSFYGVVNGKLVLLPIHDGESRAGTELGLYGSAVASSTAHCVRGGTLTTLSYGPTATTGRYLFRQATWRLRPDGLWLIKAHSTIGTGATILALERRTGFYEVPFKGCTLAR